MKSETIFVRQYPKYGYEVRTEKVDPEGEGNTIEMKSAYTSSGMYIGNRHDARVLCEEKGIAPELIDSEHNVCSIGFCVTEQKWYGWSHRAIFGFSIGSSVKKGDCAYIPSDVTDLAETLSERNDYVEIIDGQNVQIATKLCTIEGENDDGTIKLADEYETEYYTVKTGRGEWTAKNLDDARQMAIDFANDVA